MPDPIYLPFTFTLFLLKRNVLSNYQMGDNEFHLTFKVDDFAAAHALLKRWAAFVLKTRRWAFTSSTIRMIIGLKLSLKRDRKVTVGADHYGLYAVG